MKSTKIKIQTPQLFPYRFILKEDAIRNEFFLDTTYINLNRLRFFSYFIVVLVFSQLYSDIFLGDFWETFQVNTFMVFDILLFFIAIIILLATHIKFPKTSKDIKQWHEVLIYSFVMFQLLWTTGVSVIEARSAISLPTFLIGVFASATLFILRGIPFMIMLLISLGSLILGLNRLGLSINEFVTQYSSVVVLVVLAWIISRILFNTRIKSFHATNTLENARNNLDRKVKERTTELRETNVKLRDEIIERKRYEVYLEIEKRKAEEADRLKSVFLANMSHEIRTPLNGLLGFSDLLGNDNLSHDKRSRYLEIIQNNGEQLLRIIDDIMDISMIESNQLKVNMVNFRISQILPNALTYFSNLKINQNKNQIDIVNMGFEENAPDMVNSDPSRVQQVLYNLLNNALKFTNEGSIRFGGRNDDGYIMLYVEDTGIGLDISQCNTIFKRFRQGEESISRTYGGTGLGLSISKGIVEILGGLIWVDFSYTEGARFCFTIPSKEIQERENPQTAKDVKSMLTEKEIIISDNDPPINTPLTYFLQTSDSQATCYKPESFSAKDLNYEPTLIVLDIECDPDLVLKIANDITKHLSRTRIMVICNGSEEYTNKFYEAGCSSVLRRPLNYQVFLQHLKRMVG